MKRPPLMQRPVFQFTALLLGGLLVTLLLPAIATAQDATAQDATAQDGIAQDGRRVIVLGFDGADGNKARQWMDEGYLPHMAELAEQGTFAPMRVTIPSQTPVAWSTFSTGLNPGRHTIFDFLRRDPATYQPAFGFADAIQVPFLWGERNGLMIGLMVGAGLLLVLVLLLKLLRLKWLTAAIAALVLGVLGGVAAGMAAERYLPKERPEAINYQQGETFWETLGNAGKRVKVIRMPVTFPPKPFSHGQLLTGLGTPDLSARIGKPFYFTSELFLTPKFGNDFSIEVVELYDNQGELITEIKGPPNKLFPEQSDYIYQPMKLTVAEDRSRLDIDVSGQQLSLEPGQWSDWVRLEFPFNDLISLHGMGRFHLLSLEPEVRLYLSPVQFDPENLPEIVDISTPRQLAPDLAAQFGLYKTIGWATDTWSLSEGTIDEEVFMQDVENTVSQYEKMLYGLLDDDDWDVLFFYFEFTDRVQHMMYRYFDPEHPLYDADKAAKFAGTILESYQRMDAIIGNVLEQKPQGSDLIVASDHGFASFRHSVNYNTWLVENGYMTLKGQDAEKRNLEQLFEKSGDFLSNVDWSQTKAYALGLGQIYINLQGRERDGIVKPEEYDALVQELKLALEAYVDEETGENPVAYVFTRDEAFGTYDPNHVPDLVPSNNDGYRVGWQDSLGGFGTSVIEPNTRPWSGDHCSVYPPLVPGILFSTLQLDTEDPYMADVMPTLLELYGVEPPVQLDGKSLLVN